MNMIVSNGGHLFVVHIDWRYEMPVILTSLQSLDNRPRNSAFALEKYNNNKNDGAFDSDDLNLFYFLCNGNGTN